MPDKKYESFGVDRSKQTAEPTLVEKAQEEEAKAKHHTGIASPAQIAKALTDSTTNHQKFVRGPREEGTSRLEEVLDNGNHTQAELSKTTTQPSIDDAKAKEEAAKKEGK